MFEVLREAERQLVGKKQMNFSAMVSARWNGIGDEGHVWRGKIPPSSSP
jgi:hypothetical protein